ncbi:hypothetical protein HG530_010752 [Fusarium avenaceum]|nr:hypothetical protein HG530_010752 [Fusarium avenaceum]
MAAELYGISDQQSDGGACEVRGLGLLHNERACKVTPALGGHSGAEAHVADNDGREGVDDTVGNSGCENGGEDQQCFGIGETEGNLAFVEGLVLDTGVVGGNSLDGDESFAVVEESSVRRRIGEEEPDDEGPETGSTAELEGVFVSLMSSQRSGFMSTGSLETPMEM